MSYLEERRRQKQFGKPPKEKKFNRIAPKSAKKIAEEKAEKEMRSPDDDTAMESWFKARRKQMVGTCQCGCNKPSSKSEDKFFRHSAAHIFPKSKFESVKYHPLNWVERAFWGGDHSNMDERTMDEWPEFKDWGDIVEKFHVLAPLLTDAERASKFYSKLEELIFQK